MSKDIMKLTKRSFPIVFACCVYLITFCFVLPRNFKHKIYSSYFSLQENSQGVVSDAHYKNTFRLHEARVYMNQLMAESGVLDIPDRLKPVDKPSSKRESPHKGGNGITLAIGVTSVQRIVEKHRGVKVGYLTQVIATLHRLAMQDRNFKNIHIYICNVDINELLYEEATHLSSVIDTYVKYSHDDINKFQEPWELFEKEKQDYQFCLETSSMYDPDYTIILEDDAIPMEDYFSTLHQFISKEKYSVQNIDKTNLDFSNLPTSWGFIKLYNPEKWAGYGNEFHQWVELISFGLIGGIIAEMLWIFYQYLMSVRYPRHRTIFHVVTFSIGALYMMILVKVIGRAYIMEYTRSIFGWHWIIHSRQCCTQAVLYPQVIVGNLLQYIDMKDCNSHYAIDHVLNDFISDHGLESYLIEPNLVTHIGLLSTLRSYAKRAAEFI